MCLSLCQINNIMKTFILIFIGFIIGVSYTYLYQYIFKKHKQDK